MTQEYQQGTTEFQPVYITVLGELVTAGVELTHTVGRSTRPTDWAAAEVLGDDIGIWVTNWLPGLHTIWYRVTDNPEIPQADIAEKVRILNAT